MERFAENNVEAYAEEVLRIENDEASYVDISVQVYFNMDGLGDPLIFNESALEASQLGSKANYRSKIQVGFISLYTSAASCLS